MTRRRRGGAELTTIYWRDIPAQINGRSGAEKQKALLTPRFQDAIDRAAGFAGLTNAHDYVAEWRRASKPSEGDLAAEVLAEAQRLETDYPTDRLRQLIRRGGHEAGPDLRPPGQPEAGASTSGESDMTSEEKP